jgi:hypothetical protein
MQVLYTSPARLGGSIPTATDLSIPNEVLVRNWRAFVPIEATACAGYSSGFEDLAVGGSFNEHHGIR